MIVDVDVIALERKLFSVKAKDFMSTRIIATTENATLSEATRLMLKNRISGMPVFTRSKRLCGIVTITDMFVNMSLIKYGTNILKSSNMKIKKKVPILRLPVKYVMSRSVQTIGENESLSTIIDIMIQRGIHTLPVTRGDKLIGVIGRRDVIKLFYSIVEGLVK